ncbi:hypothetical protein N7471_003523 [Penicillium samsonianum]|uniref:uncharacterized protein n=1 Tax=Penicillium samsonianum TaxID=1882272 RepID=UPI002548B9A4|nr:uncharacterized protein N7471_003523 [Penicillium samsonianum]KAJ6144070.1 hypothetical protein N7471_003523 [Penicillium samsonianum]
MVLLRTVSPTVVRLPQPARLYTSALLHAAEKQLGGGKCEPAKKLTDTGREQLDKAGNGVPEKSSH